MRKSLLLSVLIWLGVTMTIGLAFSQEAEIAQESDLKVAPPSFAKFSPDLTRSMLEIYNSPVVAATREKAAVEMGGVEVTSFKLACFTTKRSLEEVMTYFKNKVGQDGVVETGDLVEDPTVLEQMAQRVGVEWDKGFIAKYRKAYEKYQGERSKKVTFMMGDFLEKMVIIEIESPYFDPGTFKKENKTSIFYSIMSLKQIKN